MRNFMIGYVRWLFFAYKVLLLLLFNTSNYKVLHNLIEGGSGAYTWKHKLKQFLILGPSLGPKDCIESKIFAKIVFQSKVVFAFKNAK